jgi:hypothetical protein
MPAALFERPSIAEQGGPIRLLVGKIRERLLSIEDLVGAPSFDGA